MTEKGNDIESQFQSTLLQEERHDSSLFDNLSFEFQSTLLQEERQNGKSSC